MQSPRSQRIQAFFQSRLYKNFWIFMLKSALAVGLFSALSIAAEWLVSVIRVGPIADSSSVVFSLLFVFLFGAGHGLVAGALGYACLVALRNLAPELGLKYTSLATALVLAALVLGAAQLEGLFSMRAASGLLFFPVIPLVLSLIVFHKLAMKYIPGADLSSAAKRD